MTFNLSHCELANDNSLPWMDVFGVKYKHINSLHINSPLDQLPLARQVLDMSIAPPNSKPSSHSYVTVELYVVVTDDVFENLPFLSSGGPPQSTPVEYSHYHHMDGYSLGAGGASWFLYIGHVLLHCKQKVAWLLRGRPRFDSG